MDDGTNAFAFMHQVKCLIDIFQAHGVQLVDVTSLQCRYHVTHELAVSHTPLSILDKRQRLLRSRRV